MAGPVEVVRTLIGGVIMPVAFLGGLWRRIGTDPEAVAIEGIAAAFYQATENPMFMDIVSTYRTLALIGFIGAIVIVSVAAHVPGFFAFWVAWVGGYALIPAPRLGMFLLVVSWFLVLVGVLFQMERSSRRASSRW